MKREMSYEEDGYIQNRLEGFGGFDLLGRWVKEILEINYCEMVRVVCKSVWKMESKNEELKDWIGVGKVEQKGSRCGDRFEIRVRRMIERVKEKNMNVRERLGCEVIVKGVWGELKQVGNEYGRKRKMKVWELLGEIELIYEENKMMNVNKGWEQKEEREQKNVCGRCGKRSKRKVRSGNYDRRNS